MKRRTIKTTRKTGRVTLAQARRTARQASKPSNDVFDLLPMTPDVQHHQPTEAERSPPITLRYGEKKPSYKLSIYIHGMPGLFQYEVGTLDQAMNHFAAITTTGYRRQNDRGQMQWYSPSQIGSIKIDGSGLESSYPDKFLRT